LFHKLNENINMEVICCKF